MDKEEIIYVAQSYCKQALVSVLPIDTGNLAYNSVKTKLYRNGDRVVYVDDSEASYAEDVWRFYKSKYNYDFIQDAANMTDKFIRDNLGLESGIIDENYREEINKLEINNNIRDKESYSKERDLRNILFGSGKSARITPIGESESRLANSLEIKNIRDLYEGRLF